MEFPPLQPQNGPGRSDASCKVSMKAIAEKRFGKPEVISMEEVDSIDSAFFEKGSFAIPMAEYPCCTQAKECGALGPIDPTELWLGWRGKVPLWHKGDTVNFACAADGYPTREHAVFAAKKLWEAAEVWNAANIGVRFKWVGRWEDAQFALRYGGSNGSTLARAFFPDDTDLNTMFVYSRSFDNDIIAYISNIFQHELGHAIGLRHEFAESEGDAVPFGPANPHSVMSYKFPPIIQNSDVEWTRNVYNYKKSHIGRYKVVRYHPDN
jgi:hypothetical protein